MMPQVSSVLVSVLVDPTAAPGAVPAAVVVFSVIELALPWLASRA